MKQVRGHRDLENYDWHDYNSLGALTSAYKEPESCGTTATNQLLKIFLIQIQWFAYFCYFKRNDLRQGP